MNQEAKAKNKKNTLMSDLVIVFSLFIVWLGISFILAIFPIATQYSKGFSRDKFESIKKGDSVVQVKNMLGDPLSIEKLTDQSTNTEVSYFVYSKPMTVLEYLFPFPIDAEIYTVSFTTEGKALYAIRKVLFD